MSKTLRAQLIAFMVIAAVGITYVGGNYVRLPSLFGIGQYQVYLDLPDTGGVFTNAAVTYRGTSIGRWARLMARASSAGRSAQNDSWKPSASMYRSGPPAAPCAS